VWGSELLNLGAAGHVNVEAGYGAWPRGLEIYRSLRSDASPTFASHRSNDVIELGDF
jgi:predicted alpha/beta hydrolase family esterase